MRNVTMAFLLIGSLLLQSTLLDYISIAGVKPDLSLIFVISFGLLLGARVGAVTGLLTGLLQDIMIGSFIGVHAAAKMLAGVLAGYLEKKIFKDNLLLPVIALFAGTLLHSLVVYVLYFLFGVNYPILISLQMLIIPEMLYNSFIAPFIFYWLYNLKSFKFAR